jgi:hypothetical protein
MAPVSNTLWTFERGRGDKYSLENAYLWLDATLDLYISGFCSVMLATSDALFLANRRSLTRYKYSEAKYKPMTKNKGRVKLNDPVSLLGVRFPNYPRSL